jgi:C1A family cysteine protease
MTYSLGALKDPEDKRDYLIKDYIKIIELPVRLDFSDSMLAVRDQGAEGSCVSFSACAIKEYEEIDECQLSTRNLYEKIKQPGGGAYPRDAMKVLTEYGVPPESCQPYIANNITPACPDVDKLSLPNRIRGYARLTTLDEMKQCLLQNGCFMIAVAVTRNWFSVGGDGLIFEGGDIVGYHAIAFVGYDDELQRIKFKNSWGVGWGDNGYGYLGYSHLMTILTDSWSSIDIPENQEEGNPPEPMPIPPEPQPEPEKNFLEKHWVLVIVIIMMVLAIAIRVLDGG